MRVFWEAAAAATAAAAGAAAWDGRAVGAAEPECHGANGRAASERAGGIAKAGAASASSTPSAAPTRAAKQVFAARQYLAVKRYRGTSNPFCSCSCDDNLKALLQATSIARPENGGVAAPVTGASEARAVSVV